MESDAEWERIVEGCAERGVFGFLRREEVFQVRGEPLFLGAFGTPKKDEVVPGTVDPILRLIINAIPLNVLQLLLMGDIRGLPDFHQWSGIQLDDEERVFVWSELDMTASFYLFRLEEEWKRYQALCRPASGDFAAKWRPELAGLAEVYPAIQLMMMEWESARGLLQLCHRTLCFAPPPMVAGLDPAREIRRCRCHPPGAPRLNPGSSSSTWTGSPTRVRPLERARPYGGAVACRGCSGRGVRALGGAGPPGQDDHQGPGMRFPGMSGRWRTQGVGRASPQSGKRTSRGDAMVL